MARLLNVAEVGGQHGILGRDQQIARGAGESREVAPVLKGGDQNAVQLTFCQGGTQVV